MTENDVYLLLITEAHDLHKSWYRKFKQENVDFMSSEPIEIGSIHPMHYAYLIGLMMDDLENTDKQLVKLKKQIKGT